MKKELFEEKEVRRTLSTMLEPGAVFEIRATDAQLRGNWRTGPVSGYFDNADACVSELKRLTEATGVYHTMSRCDPTLLHRRANRLDYAGTGATTPDQHIVLLRWLLIDVDPVRIARISATDEEKEAAHKKAKEVCAFLKELGFPEPVVADSGNGYQLCFRIELPPEDSKLIEEVLKALASHFDDKAVIIDQGVFNPARIVKLYGTRACKGDDTKERPHRLSKLLRVPQQLQPVSREQLQALVDDYLPEEPEKQKAQPGAYTNTFDVEVFFQKHAIAYKKKQILSGGRDMWLLEACPFNPDHCGTEVAVFRWPSGKLGFQCKHNSCVDKHWKDFRRHFEPGYDSPKGSVGSNSTPVELPPPPPPYVPPPLDLLPDVLQKYVRAAARSLNVDVSFILLPLLSALGSAIGNSRSVGLKRNFVQPPVIWSAIIGRSGSRKSPALEAGCFTVVEHERELMRKNKLAMEEHEKKLAEWDSKSKEERGAKPEPPLSPTCLMDDMTLESLADAMQENPRGVLVKKDELSHWFESFDQYHAGKGADVSRWLSLHTGAFFGLDRRTDKRRYRIHDPRANVSGGIQPKVLRRVMTEDFFDRGLPARFVFAHPPMRQDKWSEAEVPDALRDRVLKLFEKLWLLQPEKDEHGQERPKLLPLDSGAHDEYVDYYNQCGASAVQADEHEEAAWHKLSGGAARFALIGQLAHNAHANVVTGAIMEAACKLARWAGNEAVRIYAELVETREQREQRELCEFIERRGGDVSVRDLTHYCWSYKGQTGKAERDLDALVKIGLGEWQEKRRTNGDDRHENSIFLGHLHLQKKTV